MNFDFSSLNFETLDANVNAYPDLFVNQNGVTFTRKVLEDLGYPAYVLCLLDHTEDFHIRVTFQVAEPFHISLLPRSCSLSGPILKK